MFPCHVVLGEVRYCVSMSCCAWRSEILCFHVMLCLEKWDIVFPCCVVFGEVKYCASMSCCAWRSEILCFHIMLCLEK